MNHRRITQSVSEKNSFHRAFTLIELMFVLLVLGILVNTMKNVFVVSNRHILEGRICEAHIRGALQSYLHNAISGKSVPASTMGQLVTPSYYVIGIGQSFAGISPGSLTVGYYDTLPVQSSSIRLLNSRSLDSCLSTTQQTIFSGIMIDGIVQSAPITTIQIARNLETLDASDPMVFCTGSAFGACTSTTAQKISIPVRACTDKINFTHCSPLSEIIIDKRTKDIRTRRCLTYSNDFNSCTSRSDA